MRNAILDPKSQCLATVMHCVDAPDGWKNSDRSAVSDAIRTARETELYPFLSESAERLAVATAIWERSRDDHEKHFYFNLMSLLERPYSIYKRLEPKFTIDEIDRLLVAQTLSAELSVVNSRLMY